MCFANNKTDKVQHRWGRETIKYRESSLGCFSGIYGGSVALKDQAPRLSDAKNCTFPKRKSTVVVVLRSILKR